MRAFFAASQWAMAAVLWPTPAVTVAMRIRMAEDGRREEGFRRRKDARFILGDYVWLEMKS